MTICFNFDLQYARKLSKHNCEMLCEMGDGWQRCKHSSSGSIYLMLFQQLSVLSWRIGVRGAERDHSDKGIPKGLKGNAKRQDYLERVSYSLLNN